MEIENIIHFLEPEWSVYNRFLLDSIGSPYLLLTQANEHLLDHRGKQIRPMLTLLAAKLLGTPTSLTCITAAAVEMVHTATLLHDDVADRSDMRRGFVTVQKRFSPSTSVLLGDFWLARAFQLLVDNGGEVLLDNFARAIREMSEGELFQIEKAIQRNTTIDEYFQIITKKTALLIAAGMSAGAQSAGADPSQRAKIEKIGICIGLAFQIRDDILDYSPQLDTGKPTGQDILEGKITLPLLGALEQAPQKIQKEASIWIHEVGSDPSLLDKIFDFVTQYNGIEYAQKVVEEKTQDANYQLLKYPNNSARFHLQEMISYLSKRST
ncbi:MAG: polyprenyl synthetase family protein [Prevotellaceae bacterium]|jgi:octaprenyl-diphosphate synthase|nr:polyprenyl synthetase family protein [Prevotellaceae bacterium]